MRRTGSVSMFDVLEHFHQPCLNSCSWSGAPCDSSLCNSSSSFSFGFRFLLINATGLLRANDSSPVLSLLLVAGISVSCDEDVGEVDEEEELVDKPGTTNGT